LEIAPGPQAHPADRTLAIERDEPGWLRGRRLIVESVTELPDLRGGEVLRPHPPVLAPAPARIAALAEQLGERVPCLAGERLDPEHARRVHRTPAGTPVDIPPLASRGHRRSVEVRAGQPYAGSAVGPRPRADIPRPVRACTGT